MGTRTMLPSRTSGALRGVAFLFVVMGIVALSTAGGAGEVDTVPAGGPVISAAGSYNMDPWAAA
ncbi:hypothetical protein [Catellatospora sp. NPDC049609]|uniref:hypothetical protein n=1 Tax=Catellatospora sp. NPDC049609 TaxID=3155505 RepID=UPI00342F410C